MDAKPLLNQFARALAQEGLEAVLGGNAGAALHGAPVTTLDFDFLFRPTPRNISKLKKVATTLGGVLYRPYYPAANLYRFENDTNGLQVDFLTQVSAIRSLAALKSRSATAEFDGHLIWVAALEDIIKSKRATGRPKDLAVLPVLEATLASKK